MDNKHCDLLQNFFSNRCNRIIRRRTFNHRFHRKEAAVAYQVNRFAYSEQWRQRNGGRGARRAIVRGKDGGACSPCSRFSAAISITRGRGVDGKEDGDGSSRGRKKRKSLRANQSRGRLSSIVCLPRLVPQIINIRGL